MTPYYQDDAVTIYHGDCREIAPMIRSDAVVTDPPYGFGAYATDRAVPDVLLLLRDLATTVAVFGYPETLVGWCVDAGLKPDEWVTWWPTNKGTARTGSRLPREAEHVAIFGPTPGAATMMRPRSANAYGRKMSIQRGLDPDWAREGDVWRDPSPGVRSNSHLRHHPNQKPLSVMARLVGLCTAAGGSVLDPFMGSGSTLVAARQLGRKAIGIEIEERYCEIAARRCSQEVLGLAL